MKNVVITGCSRGIGKGTAQAFIESEEYYVIGTSTTGNCEIKNENFRCHSLALDNKESIANFTTNLMQKGIEIDGIINNAAILLEDWNDPKVNDEILRKTFDVNVFGTISLTEQLIPLMIDGSHIVNVSSNWGAFSDDNFSEFQPHYKMSKAALNMYSKLLSSRLKDKHITVSSFDPGWVKTDMGGMDASKEPSSVGKEIFNLLQN